MEIRRLEEESQLGSKQFLLNKFDLKSVVTFALHLIEAFVF